MAVGLKEMVAEARGRVQEITPQDVMQRLEGGVTYCLKAPGARSLFAADTLRKMGFTNVAAMSAGVNGWTEAGLPIETISA
jgi:rhodanese-related sulfurtransferase